MKKSTKSTKPAPVKVAFQMIQKDEKGYVFVMLKR